MWTIIIVGFLVVLAFFAGALQRQRRIENAWRARAREAAEEHS